MVSQHMILDKDRLSLVMQKTEQGVQGSEHGLSKPQLASLHLEDLDVFGVIAGSTSLRRAATALRLSVNTVRNRLERLERNLGSTLFLRKRNGISITAAGRQVLEYIFELQSLAADLPVGMGNNAVTTNGEIRIGCSAGVGDFWITPKLTQLQDIVPELTVSLFTDFDQGRIYATENDIKISFARPTVQNVIVTKLATLHFLLYASDDYLQKNGSPTSVDDALNHRFVVHDAPGHYPGLQNLFIGQDVLDKIKTIKVNTSTSLYRSIANGGGIGALPTYVHSVSSKVRPINLPVHLRFDLWLSYDPSLRQSKPVRKTIDWLRSIFDVEKYPWFADQFIHPDVFDPVTEHIEAAPQH
jgi:DNA-binding transcriptional LysR family regulator